jgi:hypothetical protein
MLARLEKSTFPPKSASSLSVRQITQLVEKACRNIPMARKCLIQALTAKVLLVRQGYGAILRIGVARDNHEPLQAHAWVEYQGEAVIGRGGVNRYIRFPPLEE